MLISLIFMNRSLFTFISWQVCHILAFKGQLHRVSFMLRCGTVWLHGWGIPVFPKTTISTLLSVIISTGRPFPQLILRVLEVHINGIRGITIHITEYKIHISYSGNHDSTLFFYYFHISPLPTLAHIIAKGFSINSHLILQNYKKTCLDVSSTGSFPFSMSMDMHIHIPYHPYGDGDSTWI